jgi:hypothetical protein
MPGDQGPVLNTPFAVCDAKTMAEGLMPTAEDVKQEVYLFNFSPYHRWYFFPQRQLTRFCCSNVLIRLEDGRTAVSAHPAFDLP